MLKNLFSRHGGVSLQLPELVSAKLRTLSACLQALFGQDCRVLSDGRILNILNARAQINIGNHARIRGEIGNIRSTPVVIGDDGWLATGVTVLKGITIGDRAVIGAGSIICDDVEADAHIPAGTVLWQGGST